MILETKVNGRVRQSQNTKDLIFDIPTLIEVRSTVDLRGAGSVELTM
jgi:2-keto-4-pentenoate hydratase/2-oxohepta-3-ene-1,7-dioic acid hydratase in catechol pathway